MIHIRCIDHVVIRANDYGKMVHFYRDILGCKLIRELPAELGMSQLRAGSALIDIISVEGKIGRGGGVGPGDEGHNMDHFCLEIESCSKEDLLAYLNEKKVIYGDFVERFGARGMGESLYIEDPERNTIELKMFKQ